MNESVRAECCEAPTPEMCFAGPCPFGGDLPPDAPGRDWRALLAAARVLGEQIGLKDPDWDAIDRAQKVVDAFP